MSAFGLALTLATLLAAAWLSTRAHGWPIHSRWLIVGATAALVAAASDATLHWSRSPRVVVVVDQSPSTRTAEYHNAASRESLLKRLGPANISTLAFGLDAASTVLPHLPPADAYVLLSDGRFTGRATEAPVFARIDPALSRASDAAIEDVERDGDALVITVRAPTARHLHIGGAVYPIGAGRRTIRLAADPSVAAAVSIDGEDDDAWPENNSMSVPAMPVPLLRLWLGDSPPPGFVGVSTVDRDTLASASLLVVSGAAPGRADATRIAGFVRDLGGALLLLGESPWPLSLDAISPLSLVPPSPARRFAILVDTSGSMAQVSGSSTRRERAIDAALAAAACLPPATPLQLGSFAATARWSAVTTAASPDVAALRATPTAGPTALDAALRSLAASPTMPTELLVISDGEATIAEPDVLATLMRDARTRVSLLCVAEAASPSLLQLIAGSGGKMIRADAAADWNELASDEFRNTLARDSWRSEPRSLAWSAMSQSPRVLPAWRRAWPRAGVVPLANAAELAAEHQVGLGRVAALAFRPTLEEIQSLASRLATAPADPRFRIAWPRRGGEPVVVTVDDERGEPVNGLSVAVRSETGAPTALVPSGPGEYRGALPSGESFAITEGRRVVARGAIPQRYAAEFDRIGVDHDTLQRLAEQSGGAVVAGDKPIRLPRPRVTLALRPWLIAAALVALGAAALQWRRLG